MRGKVLFVVGLGVGYVLGTRAGRRRYEQIRSAARGLWESPVVQKPVNVAQGYAADRIGDLGTAVADGIKRAVTKPSSSTASGAKSGATASGTKSGETGTASDSTSSTPSSKSSGSQSGSAESGGQDS